MILVILAICVAMFVLGIILAAEYDSEFLGGILGVVGGAGVIASLIATIALTIGVTKLATIDDRIVMYQEENTKIEEQIAGVVEQYQKYETDIFTEVAPESSVSLVALYPDLKSDTLVQKQIEVYVENNEKIKELRVEQINGSVTRWWLYFGG